MRNAVICLALIALAACQQGLPTVTGAPAAATDLTAIPTDPSAGPAGADGATWQFDRHGENNRPRLRYASFGVEEQPINFQCEGETAYVILLRGEQRPAWPFTLQSGAARAQLSGTGLGESEVVVTATLPVRAPVLTAFSESGRLTLIEGDYTGVLNAINDAERQTIRQFFAACG